MSGASGTFPVGMVLYNQQAVEHNLVTFSEYSCMLVGKDNQRPVRIYTTVLILRQVVNSSSHGGQSCTVSAKSRLLSIVHVQLGV